MKMILAAFLVLLSTTAFAEEETSISGSSTEIAPIPAKDLPWRFHIEGEIFVLSSDGEKLITIADEHRQWMFNGRKEPLTSNWRFEGKGLPLLALHQKWTLGSDGKVTVAIQQYTDLERIPGNNDDVKFGKLIREQTFVLKDFAPINWEIKDRDHKIVVRLTPGVWPNEPAFEAAALPFSGKNMTIFDGNGQVWADQVEVDSPAPYFGVITHQGAIFLSYTKFKGAVLLGTAKNGRIRIKDGKQAITIMSETPFVPNQAKLSVYGIVDRSRRTERLNSARTYNSSDEEKFLKRVVAN